MLSLLFDPQVNNGNVEPYRGFGHIAVMTRDVYAASAELEADGVKFQKRPDEGTAYWPTTWSFDGLPVLLPLFQVAWKV